MDISNHDQYAAFKQKQTELAGMLDRSAEVITDLNMNQFRDNLKKLSEKVHNDAFKIQVVGTFKNGKSTFINSFLGEEILPAYAWPCTAVINEVKWGKEKRAVIHFCDPLPERLPSGIPEKAMEHMQKSGMKNIPPLEIPYDEIEDYAVIPFDKDPKELMLESPYAKIELFWPLPLLENGVEIIDSPGLNEHATRTKVTMDYLTKADAILFVLNAQAICSQEEMRFIENNLRGQGFDDPFFIVNRFDCIEREKDREMMRKFAKAKLDGYTTNEIFFVSARNALDGKMDGDEAKYNASGMREFERRLSEFLTKQKGKAKLSQPARELKRILNDEALYKVIPMQREILASSLDDVNARYEKVKPQLADLNTKKEQIRSRLLLRIEQCKPEFRRMVQRNTIDLTDSVRAWIDEYEPVSKMGIIPSQEKTNAAVREIGEYVSGKVEEQQIEWRRTALEPLISEKASDIFESVESDLSKIFDEIDTVNVALSGNEAANMKQVPVWQRVAGIAGGLMMGDVGLAFSAGVNGFSKELAKTFAFEAGAGLALGLLGLLNPFTLIAVIGVSIWRNIVNGQSNAMKNLKAAVTTEIINSLTEKAEENAELVASGIGKKFAEIADEIVGAVDTEIGETENQIQSIVAEMEKGKENIASREKCIKDCEDKIKEISAQLDGLIFRLVEE